MKLNNLSSASRALAPEITGQVIKFYLGASKKELSDKMKVPIAPNNNQQKNF